MRKGPSGSQAGRAFLRVSTMLLITPISPNFKGLKCSVFGRFRALQSRNIYGKIPLGNHQRKDEGSSYGNYPAKGAIYHFTAACVDCGVVFGHCLRLRHTASEKGAGHPRLVPCVCLLSVSDFPSDEGTYHSRMRVRPFRRSFFITKICLTESDYTCSIKEKDYSCRLEGGTGYGL